MSLIEAILARPNMDLAWEQVRANKGGPGIDQVTLTRWGQNWEANIERLRQQVRTNTYIPNRPKRFLVRKKDGGFRELSRLTISDKVLQRAVLNVIDEYFDSGFFSCSHGYRQKRSVATAVEQVLEYRDQGLRHVVDADIEACFDSLDQTILMDLVGQVIDDWFVLNLMRLWLKAGRKCRGQAVGVPMGAVLSPLWANIYLHQMDRSLIRAGYALVRYADDFLVFTPDARTAHLAWLETILVLKRLRLNLSSPKTSLGSFGEGFVFLGVHFQGDTFTYLHQQKKVTIRGRQIKKLYRYPPDFY